MEIKNGFKPSEIKEEVRMSIKYYIDGQKKGKKKWSPNIRWVDGELRKK